MLQLVAQHQKIPSVWSIFHKEKLSLVQNRQGNTEFTVEFLSTQAFITLVKWYENTSKQEREYHWTRLMEKISKTQSFTWLSVT